MAYRCSSRGNSELFWSSFELFSCIQKEALINLKVSAEGYESQEIPFDVSGDEATEVNVTLRHPEVSTVTASSIPTTLSPTTTTTSSPSPSSTPSSDAGLRSGRYDQSNPAETTIPPMTTIVNDDVIKADHDIVVDDIRTNPVTACAGCAWRPPMLLLFLCYIPFRLFRLL